MQSIVVPCDLPNYGGTGYGSALVGLATENGVLFSYFQGKAAARMVRVTWGAAALEISKGLSGMLVDGIVTGHHAYLLSQNAVHEYDIESRQLVRALRIPKEMHRLYHVTPGILAVSRYWSSSTLFIDINAWSVISRIALPVDHFHQRNGVLLACSFQSGVARELDGSLRPVGAKVMIPLARDVAASGDRIFAIKGPPTPGSVPEPQRATVLVRLNTRSFAIEAERKILGIENIAGVDPEGRVILGTATGVALADPESLALVAAHHVTERITALARVGERAVAFASEPQFIGGVRVCTWTKSAA